MARSNTGSTSNYYTAPVPVAAGSNQHTVACWFRADSITVSSNLVVITDASGSFYTALQFDGSNSSGLGDNRVILDGGGTVIASTTATIGATGTWNHCAGVVATSASRTAYLNGSPGTTLATARTLASLTQMSLGAFKATGTSVFTPMNGAIAEVGVWDVALTTSEITSLAKGASPLLVRPANLVSYIPLSGRGTERDWVSASAVTLVGAMAQAAHPPSLTRPQDAFTPDIGVTGGAAATAPGATVTEQGSFIAGAATGAAARAAATVTEQTSLIAGAATGAATRAGVTVTEQGSFIAGSTAVGGGAAGKTLTETTALIADGSVLDLIALGKPHAGNTGVQDGVTLTAYSGPNPITTPNALVENKIVSGTLYVDTTGVVIRNCRFTTWDYYAVDASTNGQAVTVEYCDFIGNGGISAAATLCNGTIRYNDISLTENGIYTVGGNACVIEYNYVHDLLSSAGDPHYCGIQIEGGETNLIIRGNTVIDWLDSGVFLQSLYGPINTALIDGNFIKGGSSSLILQSNGQPYPISNITVTNNILTKGAFGYYSFDVAPIVFTGNILWDINAGDPYPGFRPATGAATRGGVTVSEATSLIPGSAVAGSGTGAAVAPPLRPAFDALTPTWDSTGATFDQESTSLLQTRFSLIPGAAIGAVTAAGVTFQMSASFLASPANVLEAPGTAQGAIVTAVLSFEPGQARGKGWAVVPPPGGAWDRVSYRRPPSGRRVG